MPKEYSRSQRVVEQIRRELVSRVAMAVDKGMPVIKVLIALCPLMGLLGTVVGMIRAFNVLNVSSGQPFAITGGVGEALVATAAGLCVAILALALLSYFRMRLDVVLNDLEETAALILSAALEQGK